MALRACHTSRLAGRTQQSRVRLAAPAPARGRTSRRAAVVVQANLFARVSRLLKSYANNVVSAQEDPEKLLDQVVTEMQEDLIKMRQAAAQVMASQKQLEAKYKQAQATADDWLRRAELAVQKGEDDLAKEALRRRKAYQDSADGLKAQLGQQQQAVDQLLANTRMLEGKLTEAKNKKDTLKARAASAKTSKQIQEMIGSLNTSNAVVAFEKMEEKVMAMEAEAESTALLVGGDKLENKFAALESGTAAKDELKALLAEARKRTAAAARSKQQELLLLPEGSSSQPLSASLAPAATTSSNIGSNESASSSSSDMGPGFSERISRARAKAAALLNDPNNSQPPPMLFAKWAGLGSPQKQKQRLLAGDMESYAEVIAAEFYTLEVLGEVLRDSKSEAAAPTAQQPQQALAVPAVAQQQQQQQEGEAVVVQELIDVDALQRSAKAMAAGGRIKGTVGLLPRSKTTHSRSKKALAPPPVIDSGSLKITKAAAAASKSATKASGTTTTRVRSQSALFTPLRLLQPLGALIRGERDDGGPATPAEATASAVAAVLPRSSKGGTTTNSKRGTSRVSKAGGSTKLTSTSKAGSSKIKAGGGTRVTKGGSSKISKAAATLSQSFDAYNSGDAYNNGDSDSGSPSGTMILSRTMKAAVTRARNQATVFASAQKLQELIDAKWEAGEERVWFPAAERAALDLLGGWFTSQQSQEHQASRDVVLGELAAAVDKEARKSLKAQFRGKVVLPTNPYFDAPALKALLESRVKKGKRMYAKLCDSQPDKEWSRDAAAADQVALLEWPLWGVWVEWFWDHPSYSPKPGLQGTMVVGRTTKLVAGTTSISVGSATEASGTTKRRRASPATATSSTEATPVAAVAAPETVAVVGTQAVRLDSNTVEAVRELLEQFAAERREAEANFLAALQQQHAALEATLQKHHEAQQAMLAKHHAEQMRASNQELEWQKKFSTEQIGSLTEFQSTFAKDQIELLRTLSGIE